MEEDLERGDRLFVTNNSYALFSAPYYPVVDLRLDPGKESLRDLFEVALILVYHFISDRKTELRQVVVNCNELPRVIIDDKYETSDVLKAMNYGHPILFPRLAKLWEANPDLRRMSRLYDQQLIEDVRGHLFGSKTDAGYDRRRGLSHFDKYMEFEDNQSLLALVYWCSGLEEPS